MNDIDVAACTPHAALFASEALAYSPTDPEYAHLNAHEHAEAAIAKAEVEEACVDICMGCPFLFACEENALKDDVYGVAGGLTREERIARNPLLVDAAAVTDDADLDDRDRFDRGRVNDAAVARLTANGLSNREIADHLGCATRTVARARARRRDAEHTPNTPVRHAATTTPASAAPETAVPAVVLREAPLNLPRRVSPAMERIYTILADGQTHDREDLLAAATHLIPDAEALAWFERRHGTTITTPRAERISRGARAALDNRLSASARSRGRTVYDKASRTYRLATAANAPVAA